MKRYMVVYACGFKSNTFDDEGEAEMFAERLIEAGRACNIVELNNDTGHVKVLYNGFGF